MNPTPLRSDASQVLGLDDAAIDVYLADIALECTLELDEAIRLGRIHCTPAERQAILQTRALKRALDWMHQRQLELATLERLQSEARPEEVEHVSTPQEQHSTLEQLKAIWHRHPFLAGLFGAAFLEKLRRARP